MIPDLVRSTLGGWLGGHLASQSSQASRPGKNWRTGLGQYGSLDNTGGFKPKLEEPTGSQHETWIL